MTDVMIKAAFAGLSEESQIWQAMMELFKRQERLEQEGVCSPNLSSEGAHYQRGRLSMLLDFKGVLEQVRAESDATENSS